MANSGDAWLDAPQRTFVHRHDADHRGDSDEDTGIVSPGAQFVETAPLRKFDES
jgi:hypothetical protein